MEKCQCWVCKLSRKYGHDGDTGVDRAEMLSDLRAVANMAVEYGEYAAMEGDFNKQQSARIAALEAALRDLIRLAQKPELSLEELQEIIKAEGVLRG